MFTVMGGQEFGGETIVTVGEFINAVVPYIILVIAIFILYRPLAEPIKALGRLIAKPFGYMVDKKDDVIELFKSKKKDIVFE